ncbi:MAG: 50S ribosomal protein L24 [Bacteroidetes bacterium]|nr:MAG: 50S ribosomal protein L24 [Bacteroidota bacterium]RLD84722.1 MAG: 50S ribosomal protein L24 [Bacteroidota bacterium]
MQRKLHIKKGDTVFVNAGDYKGQKGRVLEIIRADYKAIVEGVNMVSRHTKPNSETPEGGIVKKEAPVHISNLMIVDPSTGEASRVGRRKNDNNKLVRYAKKSKEEIK